MRRGRCEQISTPPELTEWLQCAAQAAHRASPHGSFLPIYQGREAMLFTTFPLILYSFTFPLALVGCTPSCHRQVSKKNQASTRPLGSSWGSPAAQRSGLCASCKTHNKHTYTHLISIVINMQMSSIVNSSRFFEFQDEFPTQHMTSRNNHFNDVVLFRSLSSSNSSLSVSPIWPCRGWPLGPPWFWCSSALTVRISHHQDSSIDRPKLFRGSYASSRMINDF